jgi:hypothetical protein
MRLQLMQFATATSAQAHRHTSTAPYVLGAALIAIVAIALTVQLISRTRRARRR